MARVLPIEYSTMRSVQAPEDDLEKVIQIERRLDEILAEANREAARIAKAAHLASQEAGARAELEIAEGGRELRVRTERERKRVIGEIAAAAAIEASRFDAIDGTGVEELAAYLVSRLIAPLADRSR